MAQDRPAEGEGAEVSDNVIIVTAQKRDENIQDVPVSIALVDGEALDRAGYSETTDLQYVVPGLTVLNAASSRNFGFFVRGVGTSSFSSESIEGSTAFVVDGVVLGQAGASLTDLPDIERVEVLRGPQATLFGKNSSAGVINIVTKQPNMNALEGRLTGSLAWPQDERRFSAYLSGPIADEVGFSVSARLNQRDGYITNIPDGRRFNNRDEWGVRGKLRVEPDSAFDVTITGDYYERDAECCIWTLKSTATPPTSTEGLALLAGIVPGIDNLNQNIDGDVFASSKSYGVSVDANYELASGHVLTSITALRWYESDDGLDSDSSPINILNVNTAEFEQDQFSQELRLTSPSGGVVDYVLGAYFFDSSARSTSVQLFPTVPLPFFNKTVDNDASTRNMALFGQANFNLTDDLRLIAGARILNERSRAQKSRVDPVRSLSSSASEEKDDTAFLWRAGVQYDLAADVMAFATVTRGYKGGGYDTNIGISSLPDVAPEKPTNFELGFRSTFRDARLTLNGTFFYTDIKNYHASARDPGPPPVTRIFNNEASTRGFEFDTAWQPIGGQDWFITATLAYVDAKWGDFTNAPCFQGQTAAQGCTGGAQDLTGQTLPFSPDWSGTLATRYGFDLSDNIQLGLNASVSFRGDAIIAFPNDPAALQEGYALLNGSIELVGDETWKLSVYGKNLTDKRYSIVDFSTPFGGAGSYSQFIPYEAQRIIGLSAELSF